MTLTLDVALASIDALLAEKRPKVLATLAPPAQAGALTSLRDTVLHGKSLPPELEHWFRWHDGQTKQLSFSEKDNYFLHSIDSAIDAWRFLTDPTEEVRQPFKPTWVPLFENGAGDHRVLDVETGAVLGYLHDDSARATVYASLVAWAEAVRDELEKAVTTKAIGASIQGLAWTKVDPPPAEADVEQAAVGTIYYVIRMNSPQVHVKTASDTWLKAGGKDEQAAIAQLRERLAAPPAKDFGCWVRDWDVWRVCTKGKDTLQTTRIELGT